MGQINAILKRYCNDKRRFADLINGIYFKGRRVIQSDELSEGREVYCEPETCENLQQKEKTKYLERIRDVKMINENGGIFRIFALENQQEVDYSMPFRCMQYDTFQYQSQLDEIKSRNDAKDDYLNSAERLCRMKKTDKLWPVYTLCLYFGEDEWDGPRSLRDMMRFSEDDEMSEYFADYSFRLYCLNEEHDYSVFHTEIRMVFELLQFRKDKKGLLQKIKGKREYQRIDAESLEVLSELLKMPSLWKNRKEFLISDDEKEEYNMCQAIEELMQDSREEGREEGRLQVFVELVKDGLLKLEEAAKRLNLSPEELAAIM